MKEEPQDLTGIKDMWDVGILLGVERINCFSHYDCIKRICVNPPAYFDGIDGEVIAEIGWLKEDDMRGRLDRLSKTGYLCHHKPDSYGESWLITRKGLSAIRYGISSDERKLLGIIE
jgi:hypothetical protein